MTFKVRCHIHSFFNISMICVWTFNGKFFHCCPPSLPVEMLWTPLCILRQLAPILLYKELGNIFYQSAKCPCPITHSWWLRGLHFWFSVLFPWAETSQCVPFAFQIPWKQRCTNSKELWIIPTCYFSPARFSYWALDNNASNTNNIFFIAKLKWKACPVPSFQQKNSCQYQAAAVPGCKWGWHKPRDVPESGCAGNCIFSTCPVLFSSPPNKKLFSLYEIVVCSLWVLCSSVHPYKNKKDVHRIPPLLPAGGKIVPALFHSPHTQIYQGQQN